MAQTQSESGSRRTGVQQQGGPVARLSRFIREVVAELAKVIWPTRTDLVTYTIVVIIFVAVMVAIVAGLDLGLAKVVVWAFG